MKLATLDVKYLFKTVSTFSISCPVVAAAAAFENNQGLEISSFLILILMMKNLYK